MTSTLYGPLTRGPAVAPTEQRIVGAPRIWGQAHDDKCCRWPVGAVGAMSGRCRWGLTPFERSRRVTIRPGVRGGDLWCMTL